MEKRIVVLGAGESGTGAAVLAAVNDYDVFVSDKGEIADKYKELLKDYNVLYEEKQHTEELILNADEIIKSPGIPETAPMVVKARQLGIPMMPFERQIFLFSIHKRQSEDRFCFPLT